MNELDKNAKIIWDYMLMHHALQPADAIFALGSNDLWVASRAAELFHQNYAPYVICSGGNGKDSKFSRPEAIEFAEVLKSSDVPEDRIILETEASNTGENILFTRKLLEEMELSFHKFILVQKPYMERRTYATFRAQWPEAECMVTSPQVSYEEYADKYDWVNTMVGDLQRIKEYPSLGFQIPQEIPPEVWRAYKNLVRLGYDRYLIK